MSNYMESLWYCMKSLLLVSWVHGNSKMYWCMCLLHVLSCRTSCLQFICWQKCVKAWANTASVGCHGHAIHLLTEVCQSFGPTQQVPGCHGHAVHLLTEVCQGIMPTQQVPGCHGHTVHLLTEVCQGIGPTQQAPGCHGHTVQFKFKILYCPLQS